MTVALNVPRRGKGCFDPYAKILVVDAASGSEGLMFMYNFSSRIFNGEPESMILVNWSG